MTALDIPTAPGRFTCGYCDAVRFTTLPSGPRERFGKTICDACRRKGVLPRVIPDEAYERAKAALRFILRYEIPADDAEFEALISKCAKSACQAYLGIK